MAYTEVDVDAAARHVREGRERVENLPMDIELARKRGMPTALAEEALISMLHTQDLMERHERKIRREAVDRKRRG